MSRRIMTTENLEEDVRIENHLKIGRASCRERV